MWCWPTLHTPHCAIQHQAFTHGHSFTALITKMQGWPEPYIYSVYTIFWLGFDQMYSHIWHIYLYNSGQPNTNVMTSSHVHVRHNHMLTITCSHMQQLHRHGHMATCSRSHAHTGNSYIDMATQSHAHDHMLTHATAT